MGFYRTRTFRGKEYWYFEERWREGKKVRSRSTYIGPVSVAYQEQRWQQKERTRVLDKLGVVPDALRPKHPTFEQRHLLYRASHGSPGYRAAERAAKIRDVVQAEDRGTKPYYSSPTAEEEAQHAERRDNARDANDRAAAERDE